MKFFLLIALFFSAPLAYAGDRPNIIFILADDLGIGDLGCYGQQNLKHPPAREKQNPNQREDG